MPTDTNTGPGNSVAFTIGRFAPRYYPNTVEVDKARNLEKKQSMCDGQYIYDLGGENRVIKVRGYVRSSNLPELNTILNSGRPMELISMNWSGEVMIDYGTTTGPSTFDGSAKEWLYEFNIKAVSTGRDEPGNTNYGVINDGNTPDPETTFAGAGRL